LKGVKVKIIHRDGWTGRGFIENAATGRESNCQEQDEDHYEVEFLDHNSIPVTLLTTGYRFFILKKFQNVE
jgi:hypothetical protein